MNRLEELLLLWQDQTITPDEVAELKILLAHPDGRAKLAAEFFLTGVVLESLRVQSAGEEIHSSHGGTETTSPTPRQEDHARDTIPGRTFSLPPRLLVSLSSAVAVSLLIAAVLFYGHPKPEPTPAPPIFGGAFAQMEQMQGEIFVVTDQQMRPAQAGEVLVPGQGIATQGAHSEAVVQMKDAVRLKLGSDTRVFTTIEADPPGNGGPRLVLEKGDLLVEITRSLKRKKMSVQTALGLAVAETEEAALHVSDAAGVVVVRGEVSFHHKATGKSIRLQQGEYLAITTEGELYASRLFSGNAHLWTTFPRTGLDTNSLGYALAFSPDSKQLAAATRSGEEGVRIGSVQGQEQLRELRGDRCVQFSADGKWLAAADQQTVRVYDLTNDNRVQVLSNKERKPRVNCVAFSPDGQSLAVGRAAAKDCAELEIWDVSTGTLRQSWREHRAQVTCLAFSADGKLLASGSVDKTVILWDMDAGKERTRVIANATQAVWSLAFAPRGHTLAIATGPGDFRVNKPGEVVLWNIDTEKVQTRLQGHSRAVTSVIFSTDGQTLITGSADTTVRFWDLKTGREYGMLKGHKAAPGFEAVMVALSPDGASLATASFDQTVKLWPTTWIRNHPAGARLWNPLQPSLVASRGPLP